MKEAWHGPLPTGWVEGRVKSRLRVVNGSTPKSSETDFWDGDIVWVTPEDLGAVKGSKIANSARQISSAGYRSCGASIVPPGSLILSTRAPIGHLGVAALSLCTNQGCRSLVPTAGDEPQYFYYALVAGRLELQSRGQGSTFQELSSTSLGDVPLPHPPLPIQKAIAAYLDRKTAAIDTLIEKKEKLIALLAEKRAALINRAVTKGLNPDVPMKDSGVPWIGEIPAHWKVMQMKHVTRLVQTGPFGSQLKSDEYVEGHFPVVNPANLAGGQIFPDEGKTVTVETANRLARHRLVIGDVVFGRRGELGRCAAVSAHEEGWLCGTGSILVRLRQEEALPGYISLLGNSSGTASALSLSSVGSTMENMNTEILGALQLPVPPPSEQSSILAWSARTEGAFKSAEVGVFSLLERLREYRQAFITAAVTGQIEVSSEVTP